MKNMCEIAIECFRYREIKRCLRNPEYVMVIENEKGVDEQFKSQLFTLDWSFLTLRKRMVIKPAENTPFIQLAYLNIYLSDVNRVP